MFQTRTFLRRRATSPIHACQHLALCLMSILLTIFSHPANSQGNSDPASVIKIKGALGFVLGESKAEAVGKASVKYNVLTEMDQIRTGNQLSFSGGRYMRWVPSKVDLEFKENKLGWIFIEIEQNSFDEAGQVFDEIKRKLLEKYGLDLLLSEIDLRVKEGTAGRSDIEALGEDEVANIMWIDAGYVLSLHLHNPKGGQPYVLVTYQDVMLMNEIEESSDY